MLMTNFNIVRQQVKELFFILKNLIFFKKETE